MSEQVVVIYCLCDDVVKALNIRDYVQCKMDTAEVMTFALLSGLYYGCDYKKTRLLTLKQRYFTKFLSHSRLIRRINQLPETAWRLVFSLLRLLLSDTDHNAYIVDSFPVKAYENHKSSRAKIFAGKEFHGYNASKKLFFFGIKVHMIIDGNGLPVEFFFTPARNSDTKSLEDFSFSLTEGSLLFGDRAYTSYEVEDLLRELSSIQLVAKRKKNLKRQHSRTMEYLLSRHRNRIETVFSSIVSRMPRYIRAKTEGGFCLKVFFFIIAYMINLYHPLA